MFQLDKTLADMSFFNMNDIICSGFDYHMMEKLNSCQVRIYQLSEERLTATS
jgi:hypothetical protein